MIYDCFNFYNELDLLEMRFNILYDHVDKFVIVESSITHSGQPKPFYYEENKERFSKWVDKIIHYKVYDTPSDFTNLTNYGHFGDGKYTTDHLELNRINGFIRSQTNRFDINTQPDYGRDFFQKECVRRALVNCDDNDVIMLSDADEIFDPSSIQHIKFTPHNAIYRARQLCYYYKLNILKETGWYGTRISRYRTIKDMSFNEVRGDNKLSTELFNGGWHFSFMGGKEMVKNKLINYSARDMVNDNVLNNVDNLLMDPFFRGELRLVDVCGINHPKYILNNLDKYKQMGWIYQQNNN